MYNKIIENLYIGDLQDATNFEKEVGPNILCVLEFRPANEPKGAMHIAFLEQAAEGGSAIRANKEKLDLIADMIDAHLKNNNKLLVHCAAGLERSPLAIVWYLHKHLKFTIDDAYELIKKLRPQTMIRKEWLRD